MTGCWAGRVVRVLVVSEAVLVLARMNVGKAGPVTVFFDCWSFG